MVFTPHVPVFFVGIILEIYCAEILCLHFALVAMPSPKKSPNVKTVV